MSEYKNGNLNYLKVDNLVITGASNYSFLHEKTYNKSPERATGQGAINNLNSYSTFISQHLKFDFNYMPVELYREIIKLLLSKNEFYVTAYDLVYDRKFEGKMYFYPQSMPTVYHTFKDGIPVVMGIRNATLELVSTNDTDEDYTITYHSNIPNNDSTIGISAFMNQEIILGYTADFEWGNKKIIKWAEDPEGTKIYGTDGSIKTINSDLVLYAIWEDDNNYYLSFDYNGGETENKELNRIVTLGNAIGELPTTTREGFTWGGWYQLVSGEGTELTATTLWSIPTNVVIYAKWIPINYTIQFELNGGKLLDKNGVEVNSITQGYTTTIEIYNYTPKKDGFTFAGYYSDKNLENPYSFTIMPLEGRISSDGEGDNITYSNKVYLKWE